MPWWSQKLHIWWTANYGHAFWVCWRGFWFSHWRWDWVIFCNFLLRILLKVLVFTTFSRVSSWWYFGVLQRLRIPVFTENNLYKQYLHKNYICKFPKLHFPGFCPLPGFTPTWSKTIGDDHRKITNHHLTAPKVLTSWPDNSQLPNEIWRRFWYVTATCTVSWLWVINASKMALPAWISPLLCRSGCFSWMTWT